MVPVLVHGLLALLGSHGAGGKRKQRAKRNGMAQFNPASPISKP